MRDDGSAGFDPERAMHLFGAFQRLHSAKESPGRGMEGDGRRPPGPPRPLVPPGPPGGVANR